MEASKPESDLRFIVETVTELSVAKTKPVNRERADAILKLVRRYWPDCESRIVPAEAVEQP